MNKTKRHLLALVTAVILLTIPTVVVLAKELGSLTISGPGIEGEMTIDHQGGMMKLEQTGFFDQSASIKPPENLGAGYNITAYLNLDGTVVPFVQMVYYAAQANQPGFVHYTARLTGETLKPVDQWRQLNNEADTAFRGLMAEYKITLHPALPVAAQSAPIVKPAIEAEPVVKEPVVQLAAAPAEIKAVSAMPTQLIVILGASLLVLLGAGMMIKRRAEGQRSPQP